MSITAKELARLLNLSPAAVSMALNNRVGVSSKTRKRVLDAAKKHEYDFSRISAKPKQSTIYFICYQASTAIFSYAPIFDDILRGAIEECNSSGVRIKVQQFYQNQQDLAKSIAELRVSDCCGIMLLGTEMSAETAREFTKVGVPVVIVDSYLSGEACSCVLIDNEQGAHLATEYLIRRRLAQPGYLKSFVPLQNFEERSEGFQKALRKNGMHPAQSIVHTLAPTIAGAEAEMLEIIDRGDVLADCYFAENDLIAIGVMQALKSRGYRIPEDIAIIGFDNISEGQITEPALTTINIPRTYMGRVAIKHLTDLIQNPIAYHLRIEVCTELVERRSV